MEELVIGELLQLGLPGIFIVIMMYVLSTMNKKMEKIMEEHASERKEWSANFEEITEKFIVVIQTTHEQLGKNTAVMERFERALEQNLFNNGGTKTI